MPIDQSKIGVVAAELMDQLEAYGPEAEIDHVMVIVTVDHGTQDTVHYAVSEGIAVYQGVGLMEYVKHVLLRT